MKKIKVQKYAILYIVLAVVLVAIIAVLAVRNFAGSKDVETAEAIVTYGQHYAFITSLEDKGQMWEEAYEGAREYGQAHDIYVEWFGKNLVEEYSKDELLEMAIAAKVDGIIVSGDDSGDMDKLVSKASENGIPVVAMWTDCYGSSRTAFVGMSSYNLGTEYCNDIMADLSEEDKSMLVLINTSNDDSSEKLVFAGLKETLYGISPEQFNVTTTVVDENGTYSIEESIREILLSEEKPADIIVCLDENTTSIMARLVVDYNKVGQYKIFGFYNSDSIIEAIKNGVITSTLSVDAGVMGEECVSSLKEYNESGFVSEYTPVDIFTITQKNVEEWMNE